MTAATPRPGEPPAPQPGWWQPLHSAWCLMRRVATAFAGNRAPQMAAAIAYQVLFSLLPVVALLVAGIGYVLRMPEVRQSVVDRLLENVPIRSGLVVDAVRAVSQASEPLTIAGVVALLWAGMGLFGTLRHALDVVWGVRPRRNLLRQRLLDLSALLVAGLLLVLSVSGTTILFAIRDVAIPRLGAWAGLFAALWSAVIWLFPSAITFAVFSMLYRYVPHVHHRYRDVWPGAVTATVLFEAAKHLFAVYVANFSRYEVLYGALGAVMLFLLWVYVSALILLLGAEVAAEWKRCRVARADADRLRRPRPALMAVPRTERRPWPEPAGRAP